MLIWRMLAYLGAFSECMSNVLWARLCVKTTLLPLADYPSELSNLNQEQRWVYFSRKLPVHCHPKP